MSSPLFRTLGPHTSRRALKSHRKEEIKELKKLVKFAERYDPLRKVQTTFIGTLAKLGWPYKRDDNITEGVTVLASLANKYLAFEIAPTGQYSFKEPLASPVEIGKKIVLAPELQTKHDALVARGWKVVWLPQDEWYKAVQSKRQHDARFNLLLDLTLPQAPFTPRIH